MQNYLTQTQKEMFSIAVMQIVEPLLDVIVSKLADRLEPVIKEPKKTEVRYYSRQEAADILHLSLPTLKRLTDEGVLTAIRMGDRRVLYPSDLLEKVVNNNTNLKYARR